MPDWTPSFWPCPFPGANYYAFRYPSLSSKGINPPDSTIVMRACGKGLVVFVSHVFRFLTCPARTSTSAVSPSLNILDTPSKLRAGRPKLIAFLKKRPLMESASTQPMLNNLRLLAAGLLEPHPKFLPATIISPGVICSDQPGLFAFIQYFDRSDSGSVVTNAGYIKSVLILSPKSQTLPLSFNPLPPSIALDP